MADLFPGEIPPDFPCKLSYHMFFAGQTLYTMGQEPQRQLAAIMKSAELGSWQAAMGLGQWYYMGESPVTRKDYKESFKYYLMSCKAILKLDCLERMQPELVATLGGVVSNLSEAYVCNLVTKDVFKEAMPVIQEFCKKKPKPGWPLDVWRSCRFRALWCLALWTYDHGDRPGAAKYYRRMHTVFHAAGAGYWEAGDRRVYQLSQENLASMHGVHLMDLADSSGDEQYATGKPSAPFKKEKFQESYVNSQGVLTTWGDGGTVTKLVPGDLPMLSCAACGRQSMVDLLKCSRCKVVRYCNQDCQRKHWREGHKEKCKPAVTE